MSDDRPWRRRGRVYSDNDYTDNEIEDMQAYIARLRAAVAALMATGDDAEPWWGLLDGYGFVSCGFCGGPWTGCVADVTHDADCPAMAVEAEMREGSDD